MEKGHLELLQGMPIFGGIREDILEFLLDCCKKTYVKKNSFFFREDDPGKSLFVLESGKVAVVKLWKGQEHVLRQLEAGDCFGEMALMDFSLRSASVVAIEDSTAIEILTTSLHELHKKDLEQFTLIQMNMGREVCRRLRQADEQLFQLETATPGIAKDIFRFT